MSEYGNIDPGPIMRLATGYWDSATLLAANELNLFGALADSPKSATELAVQLQLPLRSLTLLLDACVGLQLLQKMPDDIHWRYANTPATDAFLVQGRPGYLGAAIRWGADQYAAWGDLAHTVRTDQPAVAPDLHLGADPDQTRRFVLGMHGRALGMARAVVNFLPFPFSTLPTDPSTKTHSEIHSEIHSETFPATYSEEHKPELLDVGGGPGTYAMLLAQKYPRLQVTVLDLPGVVAVAEELIAGAGLQTRVHTLAGDALTTDYGTQCWDGMLFSGVLHQMDGPTIQNLFAKAFQALRPGAQIVISDLMLDATRTQPAFATLFSLQMLLTSERGAVFSSNEAVQWLESAGFSAPRALPLPPPLPYVVVAATR